MKNPIQSFKDLNAWQAGMDLVVEVYGLASKLPASERYALSSQMRRAVVSVPANIAEGHAFRTWPKMYRRHVRIALGSLAELETEIEVAARLDMVEQSSLSQVSEPLVRTRKLLHGLLRALRAIKETPQR
jgi:four helix bundle protein